MLSYMLKSQCNTQHESDNFTEVVKKLKEALLKYAFAQCVQNCVYSTMATEGTPNYTNNSIKSII